MILVLGKSKLNNLPITWVCQWNEGLNNLERGLRGHNRSWLEMTHELLDYLWNDTQTLTDVTST